MKTKPAVILATITIMGILFHPGCKTTEEFKFGILGTWTVILEIFDGPQLIEVLTFSGSDTSGTVTGWNFEPDQTGTYTVTDGSQVQFIFDYMSAWYGHTRVVFIGTIISETNMNGTGTWYDDDLGRTYNHTWSATKL